MEEGLDLLHIKTEVHGRLLFQAAAADIPPRLLLGFHGYGESAEANISALNLISGSKRWWRASPQGLHSFYTRGGTVVSSWMTSQDRELQIASNLKYIESGYMSLLRQAGSFEKLVLVGFSQGAPMAYRALAHLELPVDAVIILGGDFPKELQHAQFSCKPPILLARGSEDTKYPEAVYLEDLHVLRSLNFPVQTLDFSGGHEWAVDFLNTAGRFLDSVS